MPTINTLRKSLSKNKKLRAMVFAKTHGTCWYCGIPFEQSRHGPEIDHVIPLARGGDNHIDNLVPCCYLCNAKKGART
jgi:5-methylcytosine-specific restriction endonuclease McrA